MRVKFSNKGANLIVGLAGELDHHCADYVKRKVDAEIFKSTTKNIIFDFSKVNFMDSSGIGVIMGRFKNVQKLNGKLAVVNPTPQIRRIFELTGFQRIIPIYDSIENAYCSFNEH